MKNRTNKIPNKRLLHNLRFIKDSDKGRPLHEIDLIRRNYAVLCATIFVMLISVIGLLGGGEWTFNTILLLILMLLQNAMFGYLLTRRMWLAYLGFIPIIITSITTFTTLITMPGMSNILSIFYLLFLASIYSNIVINGIAISVGLAQLLYMIFAQGAELGIDTTTASTSLVYFVIIIGLISAMRYILNALSKDMVSANDQAEELVKQQQARNTAIVGHVNNVSQHLSSITQINDETNRSFHEMHTTFQEIANGSSVQLDSTLSINQAMQNMNELIERMSDSFATLNSRVAEATGVSDTGSQVMGELDTTIGGFKGDIAEMAQDIVELNQQMEQTTQISLSIQEIANQTNLLALNASIEAARAGEHGQGFAVVATEIRKLADLSGQSAVQIGKQILNFSQRIDEISEKMKQVKERMERSSEATQETIAAFTSIRESIESVRQLASDYVDLVQRIKVSSESIETSTQQLASSSEEATAALEQVTAMTQTLLEQNEQSLRQLKEAEASLKQIVE